MLGHLAKATGASLAYTAALTCRPHLDPTKPWPWRRGGSYSSRIPLTAQFFNSCSAVPFSDLYDGSRTRQLEMFQSDQPHFSSWLESRERKPTARLVIITSVEDWAKDQPEEDIYRQFCLDEVVKQLDIREPVVHAYSPNHAPMSATLDQLRQWNDVEVLLTMCVSISDRS